MKNPLKPRKRIRQTFGKRYDTADEEFREWIRMQPCILKWGYRHLCKYRVRKHPEEWDTVQKVSVVAHIRPWGVSGEDHNNIVPMCLTAHAEQEGKNKEFEKKWNVDLKALARQYYSEYAGKFNDLL